MRSGSSGLGERRSQTTKATSRTSARPRNVRVFGSVQPAAAPPAPSSTLAASVNPYTSDSRPSVTSTAPGMS